MHVLRRLHARLGFPLRVPRSWLQAQWARQNQRRTMAELLQRHCDRLTPGTWTQVGRIAVQEGVVVPRHVKATVIDRERDGRTIYRGRHKVRPTPNNATATSSMLIDGGMAILLSPSTRQVTRIADGGQFDDYYVKNRIDFMSQVPSPSFAVEQAGYVLTEALLDGTPLGDVPADRRVDLLDGLMDSLHLLVELQPRELPSEVVQANVRAFEAVSEQLKDSGLSTRLDLRLLKGLLSTTRGVPAKGRAIGQNNLVIHADRLHCIDFPRVSVRLAWSDVLTLVVHTDSERFCDGLLDQRIERLLMTSEVEPMPPLTVAQRATLVLATLVAERIPVDRDSIANGRMMEAVDAAADAACRELVKDWQGLLYKEAIRA